MGSSITLTIDLCPQPTDEVRALIGELDGELSAMYSIEQRHGLTLDAIFQPHIRFFLARLNGVAVGCGGVALFPEFAEVKRMFVRESVRGRGVAQALLARIEAESLKAGQPMLRLETGQCQGAALRLYAKAGFKTCAAFGVYTLMSPEAIVASVFMEKQLKPPTT
jgi:putative acetyltransferase